MNNFDGLILDVDGTIWNTTGIVAQAWNKTFDDHYPLARSIAPVSTPPVYSILGELLSLISIS